MKQIVYLGKTHGYVTPEDQADFLMKFGHLEGVNGNSKLYTYNGSGFRVIIIQGKVAQIIKMSEYEIRTMASCSKLKFGDF